MGSKIQMINDKNTINLNNKLNNIFLINFDIVYS